jgi:hypothetical protein
MREVTVDAGKPRRCATPPSPEILPPQAVSARSKFDRSSDSNSAAVSTDGVNPFC